MTVRAIFGRRCGPRRLCAGLFIFVTLGWLLLLVVLYGMFGEMALCSPTDSKQVLKNLCLDYQKQEISGNLCPDLCILKNIKFVKCLNFPGGKEVYLVKHGQREVIAKSRNPRTYNFHPIYYIDEETRKAKFPDMKTFIQMTSDSVRFNVGVDTMIEGEELVRKLWPVDVVDYIKMTRNQVLKNAAMQSLWSLLQQDEYFMLRYFYMYDTQSRHFPKMYGTCGHFYFLENTPPGKLMDFSVKKLVGLENQSSWRERVELAVNILDLLNALRTQFAEEVHLCDVKGINFGVDGNGTLKLIDVDSIFLDTKMRSEMRSGEGDQCQKHSDCDFFDCQGWCDMKNKTCLSERINDNFQLVCQKIFQSHITNMYSGLLHNPSDDIASTIRAILDRCSNPPPPSHLKASGCSRSNSGPSNCLDEGPKEDRNFKASQEDFKALHDVLQHSLRQ